MKKNNIQGLKAERMAGSYGKQSKRTLYNGVTVFYSAVRRNV
jgi:hypothetical protein